MSIQTIWDNKNETSAEDFANVFKNLYSNGVLCPHGESIAETTALKVSNSNGNAEVRNGSAIINGRIITVSDETVPLSQDGTYKIVLEWSAALDGAKLKALAGSETLIQTDTQYQSLLATVVKSGTNLSITDLRQFVNRMTDNQASTLQTELETGWSGISVTLTYTSATTVTLSDDVAGIHEGTKIKLTQGGTVKKFFVTKKSGLVLTLFGGTDFTLTSSAITNVFFSNQRAPLDFPLNPDKWTIRYYSAVSAKKTNPVVGTVNNFTVSGNLVKIDLPIGVWDTKLDCCIAAAGTSSTFYGIKISLSSSPTALDTSFISYAITGGSGILQITEPIYKSKTIEVTEPTSKYIVAVLTNGTATELTLAGESQPTIIEAVCAYL